jgi:hypothetical protein
VHFPEEPNGKAQTEGLKMGSDQPKIQAPQYAGG